LERDLGAFGEKLRRQREQRGIELDKISNATKISARMLRALEEEHFDQLPGGVFNKGFVRAYARQVGLDAEEAVNDYLAALRESQVQAQSILPDFRRPVEVAVPAPPQPKRENRVPKDSKEGNNDLPANDVNVLKVARQTPRDELRSNVVIRAETKKAENKKGEVFQPDRSPQPIRTSALPEIQPESPVNAGIPWGKLAGALLAVSIVLAVWNLRRQSRAPEVSIPAASNQISASPAPAQPSVPMQPDPTSPVNIDHAQADQARTKQAKTEPTTTTTITPPLSTPPVTMQAPTTVPQAVAATSAKSASPTAASAPSSEVNSGAAKAIVHSPGAKAPSTFTLLVRAEKTCWVSISADGKPVAEETLIAPAHTSVRATQEISVRTDNGEGISFLLNGKEIPAQGIAGEGRVYTFDARGMKASEVQPPVGAH
jgi:cytoskeletal protein RodZ